ncbi:putative protein N(5)-glutamine methyltransferase [Sanguibacter antarcticus]|uniref:putative protein N(5)-glutamine methyltransferase n=1 Tax=Sanguibacter antarcticus TaxID=372484 RepID=UPI001FE31F45|nr:putative protein N(5)-glutamine methyltransferase [Sanguibacter antarcticus]
MSSLPPEVVLLTSHRPTSTDLSSVTSALRGAGCVFAEDEAAAILDAAHDASHLADMVERRVAGTPLEQILGWAEFCGMRIAVAPGVFVPRRRTELLVREAAAILQHGDSGDRVSPGRPVVVDLCCGSGAVGAALAACRDVDLYAADIDPVAVRCARRTVQPAGRVLEGDLFDALPVSLRGRVAVFVVNAPYVPTDEIRFMPAEAREHEPHRTLDGGPDGLDVHRRVAHGVGGWLAPGGHLLVETSGRQTTGTVEAFRAAGLEPRVVHDEEIDATVVVGRADGGWRPGAVLPALTEDR